MILAKGRATHEIRAIMRPKELHPKWVMGPSATDATNFASDRGSPGENRDSNSTTKLRSRSMAKASAFSDFILSFANLVDLAFNYL